MTRFALLVLLMACGERVQQQPEKVAQNLPEAPEAVKIDTVREAYDQLDAELFGQFHNDRVTFFTRDYPDLVIEGAPVIRAVLYYVDEALFQTRYELGTDITSNLIRQHGRFRIRGLNNRNAYFIKRLQSNILYGNEIVSLINFYQLRWDMEDEELVYRVRRDTVETFYTYIERVKGYKEILKQAEAAASD